MSGALFPAGRVPFLPQVFRWAAHLEQIPVREFLSDPTRIANALFRAWQQFGYDGLFPYLDDALEAEALGCAVEWRPEAERLVVTGPPRITVNPGEILSGGRVPIALEVARRLRVMVPSPGCLVVVLPAATALGRSLSDGLEGLSSAIGAALKALTALVRAMGEIGVDLVWVRDLSAGDPDFGRELRRLARVANLARFYNRRTVISLNGPVTAAALDEVVAAGFDGVVLDGVGEWKGAAHEAGQRGLLLGLAFPPRVIAEGGGEAMAARRLLREWSGRSFLTTGEEVQDVAPQVLHRFLETLRGRD